VLVGLAATACDSTPAKVSAPATTTSTVTSTSTTTTTTTAPVPTMSTATSAQASQPAPTLGQVWNASQKGVSRTATVQAFNLGMCHGKLMYQAVEWYFPSEGGTFDPNYWNICTGERVGSN
jgi:hypothetical protein